MASLTASETEDAGLGFLGETSGFAILTTLGTFVMEARAGVATYLDVFWIGVINTLIISFVGIIAATLLGFLMGIFRLSTNVVLRGFATFYVEILRNIPLLLQIFFWYFVVLRALPDKRRHRALHVLPDFQRGFRSRCLGLPRGVRPRMGRIVVGEKTPRGDWTAVSRVLGWSADHRYDPLVCLLSNGCAA